jgi:Late embryogenesis abundant protein
MSVKRLSPLVLVASLGCALFMSGCAKKPTMHLNHAEVSGVSFGFPPQAGVLMTVVVDVYNPNSYDVAIRAMHGSVVFADKYTLPIEFQAQGDGVWLPADQTTPMRVPITVPIDLGVRLVREAYMVPTIPFKMTGKADVTATRTFKFEKDDYEVNEQGTLSRDQVAASLGPAAMLIPH